MSTKFTCKKEDITSAITNVSKAVSLKSTIPALEGIKLNLENSKLELTGYNLEIGITTSIDCNNTASDSLEFILNSRLFNETTKRIPSEYITYEIDDNLNIKISGGNTEYQISAISAEEYPALPSIVTDDCENINSPINISQYILRTMINQTVYAAAEKDAKPLPKPILTGELFDIENNSINIVALDGSRLAVRTEYIDYPEKNYFVVPSKALKEVAAILSDDEDKQCCIYVSTKHALFDINGYRIFTRLLEGEYHKYKKNLTDIFKTEVTVKTSDITNCIERCTTLLSEKNKAPVICSFENNAMSIECKSIVGHLNDSIEVEMKGDSVTIAFNHKFLLEAFRAADTDVIRIQLNEANKGVMILPAEGEHFKFFVLPTLIK